MSRTAFNERFTDDASGAQHLFEKPWPNGFVCPKCQRAKGWALDSKTFTFECAACGRQTSVTAGTILHRSHLSLLTWFMAIYAVASHSNSISALQLQAQLDLGSYKTAWLMLQKLHRAMVDPDRSLLKDLVKVYQNSPAWTASCLLICYKRSQGVPRFQKTGQRRYRHKAIL